MKRHNHILLCFAVILFSFTSFSKGGEVDALIVVDIDGTIGEQTTTAPSFAHEGVVLVPKDRAGDFYFFPSAVNFLKTLFSWKDEYAAYDKRVEIALFTMGSGERNEMIRSFIESKLQLKERTLGLFDFSNAVFSDRLIQRWRDKDPSLAAHWREYFDELDKPITTASLPSGVPYYKDLSRLLPFYQGLKLANIRIVDDNTQALPQAQKHQLFVFGPNIDYSPSIDKLKVFISSIR